MLILGIETSCDETAAAVVQDGVKIISNVVASSQAMHAKFGGIIPEQAAREQVKAIIPVINEALTLSEVEGSHVDAIAVTVGPGLIGSLLVGVETAKALASAWNKPIIPVNHLVGHIYANWIMDSGPFDTAQGKPAQNDLPKFPALALLVSGGHSELILMKGHGNFEFLGGTRDDAAGECFDKCARILSLGYPGGPAIEKAADFFIRSPLAKQGETFPKLPRPMINDKSFDFSFSGLKTAVLYRKNENPNGLAHELQEAITDVLIKKTLMAAEKFKVKNILLAGGVAANLRLREKLQSAVNRKLNSTVNLFVPPISLCTDNAAYIASAAFFNQNYNSWENIEATPDLSMENVV